MIGVSLRRGAIEGWLAKLPDLQGNSDAREIDAQIHHALYAVPVRQAVVIPEHIPENDPPEYQKPDVRDQWIAELNATIVHREWVSERYEFEITDVDEYGRGQIHSGRCGYENTAGEFVIKPELSVVPQYLSTFENGAVVRGAFFGDSVSIRVEEVDDDFIGMYRATLLDASGYPVTDYCHWQVGASIIGAVFQAVMMGRELTGYMAVVD